jgi:hypothetical protein
MALKASYWITKEHLTEVVNVTDPAYSLTGVMDGIDLNEL